MTEERLRLGSWGEEQAAVFLRRRGMKVVARNLRTPVGEIDIIARDRRFLIFVEVKTRRSAACGAPAEAVGPVKQRQIIRTAQWYLLQNRHDKLQPRFDVVSVFAGSAPPRIEHIEDAFGLDDG